MMSMTPQGVTEGYEYLNTLMSERLERLESFSAKPVYIIHDYAYPMFEDMDPMERLRASMLAFDIARKGRIVNMHLILALNHITRSYIPLCRQMSIALMGQAAKRMRDFTLGASIPEVEPNDPHGTGVFRFMDGSLHKFTAPLIR